MRILLVDDSPLFRDLIRRFVEEGGRGEIVGEVARADAVEPAARELRPDVVIMDWSLPDRDGIWATRAVKEACPELEVVALTSTTDPAVIEAFFAAGVAAQFDKADLDSLVRWIGARSLGLS